MWYKLVDQQVELMVFVKTNAKKTEILGVGERGLEVALHALPKEGEANNELIAHLAKRFHVPKSQVILRRGAASRRKLVVMPLTGELKNFIQDAHNIEK